MTKQTLTITRSTGEAATYAVGDEVAVFAFGAWRTGWVTGLGRTKVRVRYLTNREGSRSAVRSFDADNIEQRP